MSGVARRPSLVVHLRPGQRARLTTNLDADAHDKLESVAITLGRWQRWRSNRRCCQLGEGRAKTPDVKMTRHRAPHQKYICLKTDILCHKPRKTRWKTSAFTKNQYRLSILGARKSTRRQRSSRKDRRTLKPTHKARCDRARKSAIRQPQATGGTASRLLPQPKLRTLANLN